MARIEDSLPALSDVIHTRLGELVDSSTGARETQARRDALIDFERLRSAWVMATRKALRGALTPRQPPLREQKVSQAFELLGNEVVEQQILSSRLALAILDKATWELNDLRLRMQYLEGGSELARDDILRPEAAAQLLIDQWAACALPRETWMLVRDTIEQNLVEHFVEAYHESNDFLIRQGVMPTIDLAARVRRGIAQARPARTTSSQTEINGGAGAGGPAVPEPGRTSAGANLARTDDATERPPRVAGESAGRAYGSAATPSTSARGRANGGAGGVLRQLKRMLAERVAGFDRRQGVQPSPALSEAISYHATHIQSQLLPQGAYSAGSSGGLPASHDDATVQRVASDLRHRSNELKQKAVTSTEKATVEIVALMFQSILAEERIPPVVRVWFARLQMPVLRVAIAEPEFFGSYEHPARQLIDRMGSCAMGFDSSAVGGSALEAEIKRVVQVIEQYPETGRRVFQLVWDEFERFLSKFLTEKGVTGRVVGVAQQVEQKETMVIQYTIEMRNLLGDMPVREEIREFLFKVWTEVLAVAAMKHGPQHEETVALKKAASELVWAASAKPNRDDRAQVIASLPRLLQRLRRGMSLMGMQGAAQEGHITAIGDTLADAFQSKTEAIPQARIDQMAKRLAHLEDFVAEDPATDLPLNAQSIELMLGMDASMIDVVADDGAQPSDAMLAWAQELQLGNWFTLDRNGQSSHVQYAWRSERGQLHLFATPEGRSVLVQARRLAAFLQAGVLLPIEEEALTVRATRDALARLDADPERLLK